MTHKKQASTEPNMTQVAIEANPRERAIDILLAARVLQASEALAFMGQWAADSRRVV